MQTRAERAETLLEKVDQKLQFVESSTKHYQKKATLAEKQMKIWRTKHEHMKKSLEEAREIIVLHEGLINKLSEQNSKLKAWVKHKKANSRRANSRERGTSKDAKSQVHLPKDLVAASIFDNHT